MTPPTLCVWWLRRSRRWLPPLALAAAALAGGAGLLETARAASASVLITAVYYDTYLANEPDEAFQIANVSGAPVDLAGWTIGDGVGTAALTGSLPAGAALWIAHSAVSFTLEFGFAPAFEYAGDSDPAVPDLTLAGNLALSNTGDKLILKDAAQQLVDAVVWEAGSPAGTDWSGPGVYPYLPASFGAAGQILYRKRDQASGAPVPDTNTATDWAQSTDDPVNGRKVLFPGWDLDRYFQTYQVTQTATITYLVAPDNIYTYVLQAITSAAQAIRYEGYDFDNADLGLALAARAAAGVSVTVLLDGGPVGGLEDQERWICQQLEAAGGQCWFLINDLNASPPVHDRYAFQHAKFMLIDDRWLLTGSENLNYSSMPADPKADGTSGNRGVWLWTDAAGPFGHALDLFTHDLDPAHHRDLRRWSAGDPVYGAPPAGFTPSFASGGTRYAVQFPAPFVFTGTFAFELVQSPDNALRDRDGLLGLVARAGRGDRVLVEQLYENPYWGPITSTAGLDPNPRLEAYLAAARRGAQVRVLLDSAFNTPSDPRSNTAACAYVNGTAAAENLDAQCLLGNPGGTGLHNKMVLVAAGGQGWVHTGSINGSENSSKQNRELAVQVESSAAYAALADVFWADWQASGGQVPVTGRTFVFLPLVTRGP